MRFGIIAIASMLLLGGALVRAAQVAVGPIHNPVNDHEYYLLSPDSWSRSEDFADSIGGHLVSINDSAEQSWVYDTFGAPSGTDRSIWIGLTDGAVEGELAWTDGSPVSYTNWYMPRRP